MEALEPTGLQKIPTETIKKSPPFLAGLVQVVEPRSYCNCGHTALAQTVFMIVGAPL